MSFMHFDGMIAAAGDLETVQLSGVDCHDDGVSSANAAVTIFATGEVKCFEGTFESFEFNWINPLTAAPGSPSYEIRRTDTVGDEPNGPNDGVWAVIASFAQGTTVSNGGGSYSVNDILTISGGAFQAPARYNVDTVSSGAVTVVSLVDKGSYTVAPSVPAATTVIPSGGTGCTLSPIFSSGTVSWSLGAGYPNEAVVVFTVSIRKGSGVVLDTAVWSLDADAS